MIFTDSDNKLRKYAENIDIVNGHEPVVFIETVEE